MWTRRDKLLSGGINCIPSPLKRFSNNFVGTEQSKYYLITGNTKAGKTQLASYIFLYSNVLYAYHNPTKVRLKVLYFPLEETAEVVTERFMCYLLYALSKGTIRVSPTDLKSTKEGAPIDDRILKLLESDTYIKILTFFEQVVTFSETKNPTGINKECMTYAKSSGKTHYKTMKFVNNETKEVTEREVFDYYELNDPDEYRLIFIDHISLITTEQGLDLRNSINKLSSEYLVKLRNDYKFSPVVIQQQASETESLDNFKQGKLKPSLQGLSDSKYTGRDANLILGIFAPFRHELQDYLKYNIVKLGAYARFVEILANREGESNTVCPIYFDGCCNYITELPLPEQTSAINSVYNTIESNKKVSTEKKSIFFTYLMNNLIR